MTWFLGDLTRACLTLGTWKAIPSGKHTKNYGKSPCLMGKSHYRWPFSIAMLVYQRVLLTQCSVAGVGKIPAIHRGDECCKHHSNERGMPEAGTVPVQAPGSSGAFRSQTLAQKRQSLFFSPPAHVDVPFYLWLLMKPATSCCCCST